jgi:hypothetical protein
MPRRVLVVTTAPDPSDELLDRLERDAGPDVEVAVVAPAADASILEWLTDDDERAREEALRRAAESAAVEALGARVVSVEVGDPDPVVAVRDALAKFPADELVVVTRPKDSATWLEKPLLTGELEQFGLPVTHLVDDDEPTRAVRILDGTPTARFALRGVLLTVTAVAAGLTALVLGLYFGLR